MYTTYLTYEGLERRNRTASASTWGEREKFSPTTHNKTAKYGTKYRTYKTQNTTRLHKYSLVVGGAAGEIGNTTTIILITAAASKFCPPAVERRSAVRTGDVVTPPLPSSSIGVGIVASAVAPLTERCCQF